MAIKPKHPTIITENRRRLLSSVASISGMLFTWKMYKTDIDKIATISMRVKLKAILLISSYTPQHTRIIIAKIPASFISALLVFMISCI